MSETTNNWCPDCGDEDCRSLALAVELAAIDLEEATGIVRDHWRELVVKSLDTFCSPPGAEP